MALLKESYKVKNVMLSKAISSILSALEAEFHFLTFTVYLLPEVQDLLTLKHFRYLLMNELRLERVFPT